jgi:phosphoglycerate dehydrogenase-like enzyme
MKTVLGQHGRNNLRETFKQTQLVLPQPQNLEGILAAIGECDVIVVRKTKITRQIMQAVHEFIAIGGHEVGYDAVDTAAATDLKIPVGYTSAANTESVVEIAVGFILGVWRKNVRANTVKSEELSCNAVTFCNGSTSRVDEF